MDNFMDTVEDYVVDDMAEEIEVSMDDVIEDDYNDIDNIADIDDDTTIDEFEDEESEYEDDDEDYVDYLVSEDDDF